MPYLSALEVCSWRGAIQIHVYLYLYLTSCTQWDRKPASFHHLCSIINTLYVKDCSSVLLTDIPAVFPHVLDSAAAFVQGPISSPEFWLAQFSHATMQGNVLASSSVSVKYSFTLRIIKFKLYAFLKNIGSLKTPCKWTRIHFQRLPSPPHLMCLQSKPQFLTATNTAVIQSRSTTCICRIIHSSQHNVHVKYPVH